MSKEINQIVSYLSHFLADTAVLNMKTLNAHWNMVGPQFFMYHKLLEDNYKAISDGMDEIAEQIRMRGKKAPGTMQEFLKLACLKEGKKTATWQVMIKDLILSHESMVEHAREAIAYCDEVLDQGTSDMLVDKMRFHDKAAWLLRSHFGK